MLPVVTYVACGRIKPGRYRTVMESSAGTPQDFEQWWNIHGEWVETPNQRRGGESGVQRLSMQDGRVLYAKRQVGHIYRSLCHPFGRPTVLRERDALIALERIGVKAPHMLYCDVRRDERHNWRGLLISEELTGFLDLDSWYAAGGREQLSDAEHDRLLQSVAELLARFHRARWRHGCLYQKHVFARIVPGAEGAEIEVALLDLEKSRRTVSSKRAARHDMQQLRRHSSWSAGDWARLGYFYERALGSTLKGLWS